MSDAIETLQATMQEGMSEQHGIVAERPFAEPQSGCQRRTVRSGCSTFWYRQCIFFFFFLMEVDKDVHNRWCSTTPFSESTIGTFAQNAHGAWELALKTDVGQHRCRVISRRSMVGFVM